MADALSQHYILVAVFAVLMLAGVAGTVLPVLPSVSLMMALALVFGLIDHFSHLAGWEIAVLSVLTVSSILVDYFAGLAGAKYAGAGRWSTLLGVAGMLAGYILFPPFGGFIGLFLGVLLAELARHRDSRRAAKAAAGSLLGTALGMAVNLVIAILFWIVFLVFAIS